MFPVLALLLLLLSSSLCSCFAAFSTCSCNVVVVVVVVCDLREELGKNINADEAAAMGAVYQAAALSKAFKVKPFLVRDATVFPIQVSARHTANGRVTPRYARSAPCSYPVNRGPKLNVVSLPGGLYP